MAEALTKFTASDGYEFAYRLFSPANPVGTVVVLHGIQSHSLWYEGTGRFLASCGWTTLMHDRRGSGLNREARGDAPSFRRLLDDVAELAKDRPKPLVVMGISWGGKLAVALQSRHPGLCDGLVLVAPGICPRIRPSATERVRILASRLVRPTRLFDIPLNDAELFTVNPERQRFIHDDPDGLRQATARFLVESARLDWYLRFAARRVDVPALVLLAGQDRVIDNAATRHWVTRFRGTTEVIEYSGAHHTLEFERGGPPHVRDLPRWLERLLAGHASDG